MRRAFLKLFLFSLIAGPPTLAWDLSSCEKDFADLRVHARSSLRMPHLPLVNLAPVAGLAGQIHSPYRSVTPETRVIDNPALLQTYRSAVDYYVRHRQEMEAMLASDRIPAEDRPAIEAALARLIDNPDPRSMTQEQLWQSLIELAYLREPVEYRNSNDLTRLRALMANGVMPLAIFQDQPLSQAEILLYQAQGIAPIQLLSRGRQADGRYMSPYNFLSHDIDHASRAELHGRSEEPAEFNPRYYPELRTERERKLGELRRDRHAVLQDFLDHAPGVEARDRQYVAPLLFEVFHESIQWYYSEFSVVQQIPTDLRVLAKFLRNEGISEGGIRYGGDLKARFEARGIPGDAAMRILNVISRIPERAH